MDQFGEYWFVKYDNETFEKDFQQISYMEIVSMMLLNPDFKNLPNKALFSNDPELNKLQKCSVSIHESINSLFSKIKLDDGQHDQFSRWGRTVQTFLDVEKLYSIIFWNLTFIPQFVQCRVIASFIRFYKFLISFCQNIVTPEGIQTQQDSKGDGGRRMNVIIKRIGQQPQGKGLHIEWSLAKQIQIDIIQSIKPIKSPHPSLVQKIYYFAKNMYSVPLNDLRKQCDLLYDSLESQWVQKILVLNQKVIKEIDTYIKGQEELLLDDNEKDSNKFENSINLKNLISQSEIKYQPKDRNSDIVDLKYKNDLSKQKGFEQEIYQRLKKPKDSSILELDQVYQRSRNKQKGFYLEDMEQSQIIKQAMIEDPQDSRIIGLEDSVYFKNSLYNPMNATGSTMVSYQASGLISKYQLDQNKQQNKSRVIREEQSDSRIRANNNNNNNYNNNNINNNNNENIDIYKKIDQQLNDDLMSWIIKADQSLIEIRDEDINLDGSVKREVKKYQRHQQHMKTAQFVNDSNESHKKGQQQIDRIEEENQKRLAAIKQKLKEALEKNKEKKDKQFKETPVDDVKDQDLFQYSYENSQDEDDNNLDEIQKLEQIQFVKNKVPMPKNKIQDQELMIFTVLQQQMGDLENKEMSQKIKIYDLYNVDRQSLMINTIQNVKKEDKRKIIDEKNEEVRERQFCEPIYTYNNWQRVRQIFLKDSFKDIINKILDHECSTEYIPRQIQKINHKKYLSIKQNNSHHQIF